MLFGSFTSKDFLPLTVSVIRVHKMRYSTCQDKKFNERKSFFIIPNNISLKEKIACKRLKTATIVSGNQIIKICP